MVHEGHSGAADEAQAVATLLVVSMCFFEGEREVQRRCASGSKG